MHSAIALSKAIKGGELLKAHQFVEEGAEINGTDLDHWTPLHVAAYEGHETFVQELIKHDADTNAVTDQSETPLHLAARRGNKEVIELLLDHGAKIHVANNFGDTPLREATVAGHKDCMKYLRKRMNLGHVDMFLGPIIRLFKKPPPPETLEAPVPPSAPMVQDIEEPPD